LRCFAASAGSANRRRMPSAQVSAEADLPRLRLFFKGRSEQLFDKLRSFLSVEMIGCFERAGGALEQVAELGQDIPGLARE
jgi:hypothetical protein